MPAYALTIFLGAFLLFQVQPVIAKIILPWFGGSAAVWTTCLLFFQMALLLGYLYAHALIRYLEPRTQMIVHGAVLLDESGNVVRPALIWCDVRTDIQCRELTEKIGPEQLIQATCNPALPNFTLPGDTSASDRYYHRDITQPFVLRDGRLSVPTGPGLGVDVDHEFLESITHWTQTVGALNPAAS